MGERRGPGGGSEMGGRRARGEKQSNRTVYLLSGNPRNPASVKLTPAQVRVGISDGISTEVLDGLQEGAQIVTGMLSTDTANRAGTPSPFGGGPFRRF